MTTQVLCRISRSGGTRCIFENTSFGGRLTCGVSCGMMWAHAGPLRPVMVLCEQEGSFSMLSLDLNGNHKVVISMFQDENEEITQFGQSRRFMVVVVFLFWPVFSLFFVCLKSITVSHEGLGVGVFNVVLFWISNVGQLRSNRKLFSTTSAPSDAIARDALAAAHVSFDGAARPWCVISFVIFFFLRVFRFCVDQGDQV